MIQSLRNQTDRSSHDETTGFLSRPAPTQQRVFHTFPEPAHSPRRLLASPFHRVCQTRVDVCGVAGHGQAKHQKPCRRGAIRLPSREGRGLGVIFAKATSWMKLDRAPNLDPPAAPVKWRVLTGTLWSSGQRPARGRFRRCGPRCFAPLTL